MKIKLKTIKQTAQHDAIMWRLQI